MASIEFMILAPVSLFLIINPFSTVPLFLAITPHDTPAERVRRARFACFLGAGVLLGFALAGNYIFLLMGITLSAFKIAGGLVLVTIAFEMVRSAPSDRRLTSEEQTIAAEKEDIAVTPLALPLLCGPGAISTTLLLQMRAKTIFENGAILFSIPLVYFICFLILKFSAHGASWLNPIVLRVMRRLMGLLFLTVAVQFIINGVLEVLDGRI